MGIFFPNDDGIAKIIFEALGGKKRENNFNVEIIWVTS